MPLPNCLSEMVFWPRSIVHQSMPDQCRTAFFPRAIDCNDTYGSCTANFAKGDDPDKHDCAARNTLAPGLPSIAHLGVAWGPLRSCRPQCIVLFTFCRFDFFSLFFLADTVGLGRLMIASFLARCPYEAGSSNRRLETDGKAVLASTV